MVSFIFMICDANNGDCIISRFSGVSNRSLVNNMGETDIPPKNTNDKMVSLGMQTLATWFSSECNVFVYGFGYGGSYNCGAGYYCTISSSYVYCDGYGGCYRRRMSETDPQTSPLDGDPSKMTPIKFTSLSSTAEEVHENRQKRRQKYLEERQISRLEPHSSEDESNALQKQKDDEKDGINELDVNLLYGMLRNYASCSNCLSGYVCDGYVYGTCGAGEFGYHNNL